MILRQKTTIAALLLASFTASAQQATEPASPAFSPVPAIAGVIAPNSQLVLIKEGFEGTEGPIQAKDGSLLFTETRANRITQVLADNSVKTYLADTQGANGIGYLPDGRLVAVQVKDNQVGTLDSKAQTLTANHQGRAYQRTNDLVVSSKGDIYFTDSGPGNQPGNTGAKPAPHTAVYHVKAGSHSTQLVADNLIKRPNGISLSRDEKTLYVANTAGPELLKLDLTSATKASAPQPFAKLAGAKANEQGDLASGADGITIDNEGRVYVATNAGVEIFTEQGKTVGVIPVPKKPQNLAFAGKDKKTLYIVGRGAVYKIDTLTKGFTKRAK